jgi:PAS domain S-box-containing protein
VISNQPDGAIAATNEEALALIHSVLEASTEYAIVATDMDRIVVLWNEGARRLYGYESVEAVGKLNISEIYLSEDIANGRMREMFDGALRDGRWSGPVRKRRKNDEQVVVRAMITQRLDASSTTIGYLLISRDMSDELRLAAELETTNRELRAQMTQRQKAEADLSQAHQEEILRTRTLEQVSSQLKLLAEMSDLLQSCADSDEARQVTQRSLEKFFPNESGVIYLNQLIGSSLQTFVSWNNANLMSKENFEPNECWALRRGRPHVISPDNAAIRCAHFHNKQEGGSICVPMSGKGQPLGIFHLAWTENESAQDGSRDRKRLAEMVADTIALAVSNVRLREALKDQTIRDPLTRLYNRRYLDDSLNREVSRARRAETTIGIIMIDLDNF